MAKKSLHSPFTIVLFGAGLVAETFGTTYVGDNVMLNLSVVLATAMYFYMMDDIQNLLQNTLTYMGKLFK